MSDRDKRQLVIDSIESYSVELNLDYLLPIVGNLSFIELEKVLCELLMSPDRETVNLICFGIRDLILCDRYQEFDEFNSKYSNSAIVITLEKLLLSWNRNTVKDAIYTLGKTCSYRSIPAFKKAFYKLKDSDPLVLPRLFCEMQWLGGLDRETIWELVDVLISSDRYMTRWATLYLIPEYIEENGREISISQHEKYCYLQTLKKDCNQLIQAQAKYRCEEIEFNQIAESLSKPERKKLRKELEKQEKSLILFREIESRFTNYIELKNISNYKISDLETFVEHYYFFHFHELLNT